MNEKSSKLSDQTNDNNVACLDFLETNRERKSNGNDFTKTFIHINQ